VAAGTYTLGVKASGFAIYTKQAVRVAAGANLNQDAALALAEQEQQVNVTTDTVSLSVDPESNASATVITGAALDALSDDPDDLLSELQALAGPAAGPNGGQIYIDGFTGGQLPPKSSILAIRINQNRSRRSTTRLGTGESRSSPSRGRALFTATSRPSTGQGTEYLESICHHSAGLSHAVLHGQRDGADQEWDVVYAVRLSPRH